MSAPQPSPPILSPPTGSPIVRFRSGVDGPWEASRRQIVGLDTESLTENPPSRSALGLVLPGLGIVAFKMTPARVWRTKQMLADGNDNLRLIIVKRSTVPAIAAQFGREITIDPGGAVVLSNSEQNSITFPSSVRSLALNLRRQALRPLLHDFDATLAHPIPSQAVPLRLLANYIEGLCAEPVLSTAEVARLAVAHIYDLAALTMGATRDAAEIAKGRGLRVARLRTIKAEIAEKLDDQHLSVLSVALRQRVSPRYVQMLFEREGTTFSQYVIGQRLVRAYWMLIDPRFADRSITSVAFDAGFSDLSYFNRVFRRRFGGTPSEIRAEHTGM